ncbi:MAG: hypothetical protein K8H88_27405, partial [Sandaracinaceae bacterium]|nr:hypothetical protein [Sandaracinaceae bacterium]
MSPRRFEGETWWREIDREGALVTLAFGKPGKPGLAQGTLYPTEDEAIAFYDAKIAGYLANGYVELDAGAAAERRAAWGETMLMAATTPAKEEEKDAERARQREESRKRRE